MLKFHPPMSNDEVCRTATDKQTHTHTKKTHTYRVKTEETFFAFKSCFFHFRLKRRFPRINTARVSNNNCTHRYRYLPPHLCLGHCLRPHTVHTLFIRVNSSSPKES